MTKIVKKAVTIAVVAALAITALMGCERKRIELDDSEVVMTMGDTEITVGMLNFYVRYQQSLIESVYQSYLGDDVWKQELEDGVTYEDNMKETILENFKDMYTLAARADEYEVVLTEEEEAAIKEAADAFDKANSEDVKKQVSGDKETVTAFFRLLTTSDKVTKAATAKLREEITSEEANQKRIRYAKFSTTKTENGETVDLSKDEIKKAKEDADAFLKAATENGSLENYGTEAGVTTSTLAFNADSTSLDKAVIEAADKLGLDQFSEVIEGEDGYYVLQLTSEFDADATEDKKDSLADERYKEALKDWKKEANFVVKEDVWAKISLDGLKVIAVYPEDDTWDEEEGEGEVTE